MDLSGIPRGARRARGLVLGNRTARQAVKILLLSIAITIIWNNTVGLPDGYTYQPSLFVLTAAAWTHGWVKGHHR